VDISAPVLELARRLTDREGLRNVSYRLADAQVDSLGPQAYDFVTGLQATKDMLACLDPPAAEDALRGLRVTLAGHTTRDGVLFGARTWIITARTPRRPRGRAPDIEDLGRIGQERGDHGPPPDAE
jgi:hypothetical protein